MMLRIRTIADEVVRLSNDKPSAIFRLQGSFASSSTAATQSAFTSTIAMANGTNDVTAVLGISIEPLSEIEPQIATLTSSLSKSPPDLTKDPIALAEKIVKHLFNYVSGFVGGGAMTPETSVPLNIIAQWYEKFLGKVKAGGVSFLERGD
jgi:protein Hikeshi